MPGPRPTPTAILEMRGSWRAKDRAGEPTSDGNVPALPPMTDAASDIWDSVIPHLVRLGVLDSADGRALARYCELTVQHWDATQAINKEGLTYESLTQSGGTKIVKRPEIEIARAAEAELRRLEQEFGLTPSARVKVGMARSEGKREESLEEFAARRNA